MHCCSAATAGRMAALGGLPVEIIAGDGAHHMRVQVRVWVNAARHDQLACGIECTGTYWRLQ